MEDQKKGKTNELELKEKGSMGSLVLGLAGGGSGRIQKKEKGRGRNHVTRQKGSNLKRVSRV